MAALLLFLTLPSAHAAGPPVSEQVRQLLLAGQPDQAAELLEAHREHEELDPVEIAVLDGLIAQQRGQDAEAVWLLRHALELQPERVSVHLYLAQSLHALGQPEACHRELLAGEGAGESLPAYFALRARVEQDLGRLPDAFHTTARDLELHPEAVLLAREQALVLLRLGLLEAAREPAHRYLAARPEDPAAWLLLAEALRRAGDLSRANLLLEQAMLRFPADVEVVSRLAYGYALAGQPVAATRLFLRAQAIEPRFAFEIAEQERVAGHPVRALHFNAEVADEPRKLGQRLGIYVGMERWDLAASLLPLLRDQPWLDDTQRYQLACACHLTGRDEEVRELAEDITDPWLAEGVGELSGSP
ncbi:MAG: hypothetical protein ABIO70_05240 [Pseudomonadota bacterium]